MVRAGRLRDRVTFQRLVESDTDEYGNVYTGWADVCSRNADLRERTGKEAIQGGALSDVSMATMRVRSDSLTASISSADRVIARGYTWAVKNAIQVDAKDTMIEFLLERGVAT